MQGADQLGHKNSDDRHARIWEVGQAVGSRNIAITCHGHSVRIPFWQSCWQSSMTLVTHIRVIEKN